MAKSCGSKVSSVKQRQANAGTCKEMSCSGMDMLWKRCQGTAMLSQCDEVNRVEKLSDCSGKQC